MDGCRRSRHRADPIHIPHTARKASRTMNHPFYFTAEGDSALAVRYDPAADPDAREHAALAARTLAAGVLPSHCEVIPSYYALTIEYEPLLASFDELQSIVEEALADPVPSGLSQPRTIVVPVCYGCEPNAGEFGPDLARLASLCGLEADEAVRLHARRTYRIDMLGFMPGFPYLSGLDGRLRCPRLATPRTSIPAGSVGIGDNQTGVYPLSSPGGWNIIGRTPARLFTPERDVPTPYRVGDRLRFEPIDRHTYDELCTLEEQGRSCLRREDTGEGDAL